MGSLEKLVAALDFHDNYETKVAEAAEFIKKRLKDVPIFGIVLGSGLGDLDEIFLGLHKFHELFFC